MNAATETLATVASRMINRLLSVHEAAETTSRPVGNFVMFRFRNQDRVTALASVAFDPDLLCDYGFAAVCDRPMPVWRILGMEVDRVEDGRFVTVARDGSERRWDLVGRADLYPGRVVVIEAA